MSEDGGLHRQAAGERAGHVENRQAPACCTDTDTGEIRHDLARWRGFAGALDSRPAPPRTEGAGAQPDVQNVPVAAQTSGSSQRSHQSTEGLSGVQVGLITDDPKLVREIALVVEAVAGRFVVAKDKAAAAEMLASSGYAARIIDNASKFVPIPFESCEHCPLVRAVVPEGDELSLILGADAVCGRIRIQIYRRAELADLVRAIAVTLPKPGDPADFILGHTPSIHLVREQIRSVARFHDVSVLVLGETGTGKELVAQAIHSLTAAGDSPIVALNCAAIPAELFESELFGHEAGAYTGARGARIGLLESAGDGTVFLDEIGEMPRPLQAKLLRALETRTFRRIGSNANIPFRARVVSATNRGAAGWRDASVRSDLLYRLAGFTILLPPLRERAADIEELASAFLQAFSARHGVEPKRMSQGALDGLQGHTWPGTVRELRSVVEQAAILASGGVIGAVETAAVLGGAARQRGTSLPPKPHVVTLSPPPPSSRAPLPRPSSHAESSQPAPLSARPTKAGSLRDVERAMIQQAFSESGRNLSRAAKLLAIPRSTLRDKLRKYGFL